MAISLDHLTNYAFYAEENVRNATEALRRAAEKYTSIWNSGSMSFDLVAPPDPDESWAHERLLRPLVRYCESGGEPIPRCTGVFVSLFIDANLYCIAVPDVLDWAQGELDVTVGELRDLYGTHEAETALR